MNLLHLKNGKFPGCNFKKNINLLFFALLSTFTIFNSSHSSERIHSFNSAITIYPDAEIRVHETITIALPAGRHGLRRDFPTHYKNFKGIKYNVTFDVELVKQDGKSVPYTINTHANGKRILIGDPHKTLPAGIYTYELVYKTSRHIGFFNDHDELYWNVTGCGWPMPIDHVTAHVTVPSTIPESAMQVAAYTGYYGTRGHDYSATLTGNTATWKTTRPLCANEGLTIVISWPKGYIDVPSFTTKMWYGIKDNFELLWLLFCLLIIALYCFIVWLKIRCKQTGIIIPLFYPPKDLGPAHVRHLMRFGYDHKVFAAEIINMAVHGFITIENKKTFSGPVYILQKTNKGDETKRLYYQAFLDILFAKSDTLEISHSNQSIITAAITLLKNRLSIANDRYLDYQTRHTTLVMIMILGMVVGFLMINFEGPIELLVLSSGFAVLLGFLFYYAVRGYTKTGKKLHDEVEGFKLYLATAEAQRLEMVGTPPSRTPELFEKYLPYAVALNVEKQWSAQFAPIFEQQASLRSSSMPLWYYATAFKSDSFASSFGNSLTSSINSTISSSVIIPASSSGSGGGGSSGRGGGGGGGGTW